MNITLNDGFEVSINEKTLNDWNFLSNLRKIDKGDTGLIVDIAEQLMGGEKEVNKLAEHLKVDGITPADAMIKAITEIIEKVGALKN